MSRNKHYTEQLAQYRRALNKIVQAIEAPIVPRKIDGNRAVKSCTLLEIIAHALYLLDEHDQIDAKEHPQKAHNHLKCIGTCIQCLPS